MPAQTIDDIRNDITRLGKLASSRLQEALRSFENLDLAEANRIIEADDVFDVLNLSIEENCRCLFSPDIDEEQKRFLRSAERVGSNLEHIGDAACHIAKRVTIAHHEGLSYVPFDLGEIEAVALASIRESLDGYLNKDLKLIEAACLREPQLDALYVEKLGHLKRRMKEEPSNIEFLLLWFSVMKYLEKVCDYTLNIGEQAIFLATGRRLKFAQYQQLDRLLPQHSQEYRFSPYYDGISGAVVARLDGSDQVYLYKEGARRKIHAEATKLQELEKLIPDAVPKIIGTTTQGERETLLREFVSGSTLLDIYMSEAAFELKEVATKSLLQAINNIWNLTMRSQPCPVEYTSQIRARLNEVYAMHPNLEFLAEYEQLDSLLDAVSVKEASLAPGFVVWLHGDLNINNVFYHEGQVQFIDVHRSHFGDYLEDIGVFLVSTLRRPVKSEQIKKDMEKIRAMVIEMSSAFGAKNGDLHCYTRLDLSLARSYITSSRVIVDKRQARSLFETGIALLKKVVML